MSLSGRASAGSDCWQSKEILSVSKTAYWTTLPSQYLSMYVCLYAAFFFQGKNQCNIKKNACINPLSKLWRRPRWRPEHQLLVFDHSSDPPQPEFWVFFFVQRRHVVFPSKILQDSVLIVEFSASFLWLLPSISCNAFIWTNRECLSASKYNSGGVLSVFIVINVTSPL